MTAKQEQPATDAKAGEASTDTHRLATLRAGARQLIESQRSQIRAVEATLGEQAATLLELAGRHERKIAEQQEQLDQAQREFAHRQTANRGMETDAEQLLEEARAGLQEAMETQIDLRRQLSEQSNQLDELCGVLNERNAELERSQTEQVAAASQSSELDALMSEIERLEQEREALHKQLSAAVEAGSANKGAAEESLVLRERLESAVEELRAAKLHNEELSSKNKKLAPRGSIAANSADAGRSSDGFDWESQKQAMMRQMEQDFDESNPDEAQDKLTVEGAIRITDEVVTEKDREIQDLQQLLANQSSSLGDVAVGATAIAEMLDQDELIRDERENLRHIQDEWREKLRRAEVEISVERAKFARERTDLDEKIQMFERQQAATSGGEPRNSDPKAPRGNWLSRLGLKDDQ